VSTKRVLKLRNRITYLEHALDAIEARTDAAKKAWETRWRNKRIAMATRHSASRKAWITRRQHAIDRSVFARGLINF